MKSFLKFILSVFLIIAVIGIGLQFSRVSDYKSITKDSNLSNTTKANASTWQKHEQEGLNYFIMISVVCGIGLILLSQKKNTSSTDKEVIQPEVKQEVLQEPSKKANPIATFLKKQDLHFKIGTSVALVLLIAIIVGARYKIHETSTGASTQTSTVASTNELYIAYGGPNFNGTKSTKNFSDVKEDLYTILSNINYTNMKAIDEKKLNDKYNSTKIYTDYYLNNTNKNIDNKDNICLIFYTEPKSGLSPVIVYNLLTKKYGIINNSSSLKSLDNILFNIKYK